MWTATAIERCRLASIAYTWRLIAGRRTPLNAPSEWSGWSVFDPTAERRRYAERAAGETCTRCGKAPPLPGRRKCARCTEGQRARAAALRARRIAAGQCVTCGADGDGQTRCPKCRQAYRCGGRWG